MQKTFVPKKKTSKDQKWFLVDATDKIVGRMAVKIADMLRGKNKPTFTPHMDEGDYVIVINADKVKFSGSKLQQKVYYRHSGYKGGIKGETAASLMEKNPEKVIVEAVKSMLPNNKLKKHFITKLKVYKDANHRHEAQKPEPLEI